MDKIKIGFRADQFATDNEAYMKNKDLLFSACQEFEKIIGTSPAMKPFLASFEKYTMEQIKVKFPDAAKLGLPNSKLLSLYNIDLTKIKALEATYTSSVMVEPKKEDYEVYASTPEQIERYNKCKNLCDVWSDLSSQSPIAITLKFNPFVHYTNQQSNLPLTPNIDFVLRGI